MCSYLASDVVQGPLRYGYISGTQPKVLLFFLFSAIHDFDFVCFFVSMLRCQLSRLRSQIYSLLFIFIFSCFFSHYMVYLLLCRYRGANCVHL